ncbi:hypothetical protein [Streptomyces sp. NPDC058424]|uniref:hypothetical protein n=1 Tax=Streptomyces sp. NPDC058424 TaxID=3346491 RepID=UPI00364EE2C0
MTITYEWRGDFDNTAVNALHVAGLNRQASNVDWLGQVHRHRLVAEAARQARTAKCKWLHVDFEDDLQPFYFDACGFQPTAAGLIAL